MGDLQLPDPGSRSVTDVLDILVRRKRYVLLPALLFLGLATALALLLPRTYISSATILVEVGDIPGDLSGAEVAGFAEQRLQAIHRRVLGDAKLAGIANRLRLPCDREAIRLALVDANRIEPRSGRPPQVNIAFRIAYEGTTPGAVREVATELAALYPEENLQARERPLAGDPAPEPLAERFSIVEPARLPKTPSRPDIPAILLFGLLSGVGVGAWWAFRKERADNTVRGYEQLVFALPFPSAGGFPGKTARGDAFRRRLRRGFLAVSMIACVALALVLARIFATGLDVLWVNLARRIAF